MRDDRDSDIDDAIDDVARALTGSGPGPAFRESVRARLEAPRGAGLRAGWFGATAAAVSLIVIAVVLWTPNRDAVPLVDVGRATLPHRAGTPGTPGSGPPGEPDKVRPTTTELRPVTASAVAAAGTVPAPAEDPVQVDLLDVMPLDVEPLEIPMIVVDALDVDPLVSPQ